MEHEKFPTVNLTNYNRSGTNEGSSPSEIEPGAHVRSSGDPGARVPAGVGTSGSGTVRRDRASVADASFELGVFVRFVTSHMNKQESQTVSLHCVLDYASSPSVEWVGKPARYEEPVALDVSMAGDYEGGLFVT